MREHPIPQDVTGYRFHIIGNMTLKQFGEVAAGIVGAIILYKTNLVPVVKWPLMFLSGGLGALIAWVPFEERPLDHWLTVFFSVLYHPTKFFWRKQAKVPEPFLFKPRQDQVNVPEVVDLTPARRARIQEYLTSVSHAQPKDDWETAEQNQIATIMQTFDTVQVSQVSATKAVHKPTLGVRVRELQSFGEPEPDVVPNVVAAAPAPTTSSVPIITPTTTPTVELASIAEPTPETPPAPQPTMVFSAPSQVTPSTPNFSKTTAPAAVAARPPSFTKPPAELSGLRIDITPAAPTPTTSPFISTSQVTPTNQTFVTEAAPTTATAPAAAVATNTNLPFPTQPTTPNKLVGMVLDSGGKIVANAIVEIKNLQGLVARAVKTNALGQFFITTPLENGTYVIIADKAGLQFEPQRLTLTGQIVAPLQLTATPA